MKWEDIIGNEKNKQLLQETIKSQTILHSYLFLGPDGIGKSIFAECFAKKILCTGEETNEKENCKACLEFDSHNNPDYIRIDSDGKIIKIEQVRSMQEKIAEKPIISNKKVYVINDSDLMTKEAQNCLLKTLEEPPDYAVIILMASNSNKLLNTIKSRCVIIPFQEISQEELKQYSSKNNIQEEITPNMLAACNGSIAKLLKIRENREIYSQLEKILKKMENENIIDILNESEVLYKEKEKIADMLEYMIASLYYKAKEENYKLGYLEAIHIIEETKQRLSANSNYDMCIDYLLLKVWEEIQ